MPVVARVGGLAERRGLLERDVLDLEALAPVWGPAYVGHADACDPLVSPALADLTALPPLLIIAGGAESLLSCAEQIASATERKHQRMRAYFARDARLAVFSRMMNCWTTWRGCRMHSSVCTPATTKVVQSFSPVKMKV